MIEGYSVRQLSQQSGLGKGKLHRIIGYWLHQSSCDTETSLEQERYLIFDGTFLHRPVSIVALMNAGTNSVIGGQYDVRENSERQLRSFFRPLLARGLNPVSCTVDGNPQAIRVLKELWPGIVIQRCLVHIQRQGLMWCRSYPKTTMAKKLRDIFLKVTHILTKQERDKFLELVVQWERSYGPYIDIHPERGRVFSDIKRARSMLVKALPYMFGYLDVPNISVTTNGLEGYFSRLKLHYRQHRGLRKANLDQYFAWYFFFRPK